MRTSHDADWATNLPEGAPLPWISAASSISQGSADATRSAPVAMQSGRGAGFAAAIAKARTKTVATATQIIAIAVRIILVSKHEPDRMEFG